MMDDRRFTTCDVPFAFSLPRFFPSKNTFKILDFHCLFFNPNSKFLYAPPPPLVTFRYFRQRRKLKMTRYAPANPLFLIPRMNIEQQTCQPRLDDDF